jgi:ADP-ribosylglycohydrolase
MIDRRHFLKKGILTSASLSLGVPLYSTAHNVGNDRPMLLPPKAILAEKLEEAIYAFVVADAMGGPIENNLPETTKKDFANWDFTNFLPPKTDKDRLEKKGKGDGRTTDDSINLENLIGCYNRHQNHLDAYDYAENLIKELTEKKIWIAERGGEMTPNDRPLWVPERYVYHRLFYNNIEPRYAGLGNWINEGFQGIVLPVGAVNAGDPWRAYQEVTAFGMAHTESFGVEAAGVNAAAYAVAFQKNSTVSDVLNIALKVAKDGTKLALEDVLAATDSRDSMDVFIEKTRRAFLPYLQLAPVHLKKGNPETSKTLREGTNIGRPSRIACVENLPIAFAALKYGEGDYMKTLKASLFYGRDAESIAAVATSLLAAIKPNNLVPSNLKKQVDEANRRNYAATSATFFETIKIIFEKDKLNLNLRQEVL